MKKIIAILLTLAMLLSLAACGGSDEPVGKDKTPVAALTEAPTEAPTDAPSEPAPTEPPKTVFASGNWTEDTGNCTIEFLGAELFTDDKGEQSLRIWFDFTNNTSETRNPWDYLAYDLDIQQGGEDLPQAFCPSDAEIREVYNKKMNIRPGTTVRCVDQKKITLDGGNVTVLLEADSDASWELDLNNLPGAPKEPLEATVVSNPTWTKDLPLEADYEDYYHIRFDSAEVTKDGDGNRALRVTFEFTNNASEEKAMWRVTEFWAYQDGIGAGLVYPSYVDSTTTDNNFQDYLAPGETWMASAMFRLFTDSPLEVEIVDDKGGTGLGAVFFIGTDGSVTMGEKDALPEPTEPPTEAPTESPYVGTTYTTDLGYVSITTIEGWDKGTPNSNYALTIVPTDSKFGWVDIKDLQLSSLEDDIEYISVGYPGTTWTEMTIGSNTFQYMKTLTGTVCYLVAETSTGKAFDIEVRGVPLEDVLPMLESIVIH